LRRVRKLSERLWLRPAQRARGRHCVRDSEILVGGITGDAHHLTKGSGHDGISQQACFEVGLVSLVLLRGFLLRVRAEGAHSILSRRLWLSLLQLREQGLHLRMHSFVEAGLAGGEYRGDEHALQHSEYVTETSSARKQPYGVANAAVERANSRTLFTHQVKPAASTLR